MDALLEATLSNLLTALPLALAAWVAARTKRSPAWVHGLWLLVLLKLVTPPLFRVPVVLPALPPIAQGEPAAAPPALSLPPIDALPQGPSAAPATLPSVTRAPLPTPTAPIAPVEPAREIPWSALIVGLWALGAAATWMLAAQRIRLFRELLRLSGRAPARIEGEARCLAKKLGLSRMPELRVVPGRLAPMLWSAGGRAQLVLPEELLERLGGSARRTLLAHELAHFKRRDHLVRWLELLVRGLHWWNPLARWSVRGLRAAEESCCDAWVTWALPGSSQTYAGALVETAEFLSGSPARPDVVPIPPTAAGAFSHAHELERRLTMILNSNTSKSLSRRGRLGLFALAIGALPFLPAFSQSRRDAQLDELATIEAKLQDVQAGRAELADKLAQIQDQQAALRPAHSKHKHFERQKLELQTEADQMAVIAKELQNQAVRLDPARIARGTFDSGRSGARRAALKKGAELLMNAGDVQASLVLMEMGEELSARRAREVEDLYRTQLIAIDEERVRAYEAALALQAEANRSAQNAAGGGSDDRLERLEQRMDSLANMVDRLAASLEAQAGSTGGGRR